MMVALPRRIAAPLPVLTQTCTTSPEPRGALTKPETNRPALASPVVQSALPLVTLPAVEPVSLVMLEKLAVAVGAMVS